VKTVAGIAVLVGGAAAVYFIVIKPLLSIVKGITDVGGAVADAGGAIIDTATAGPKHLWDSIFGGGNSAQLIAMLSELATSSPSPFGMTAREQKAWLEQYSGLGEDGKKHYFAEEDIVGWQLARHDLGDYKYARLITRINLQRKLLGLPEWTAQQAKLDTLWIEDPSGAIVRDSRHKGA
jgi:hypothetical protein